MSFTGRKILFIGIGFYDYETVIVNRITARGGEVMSCTDRPALLRERPWGGLLSRVSLLKKYLQKKHEKRIISLAKKNTYDQVFFIKAVDCSSEFIGELREALPDSEFILYEWDSLERFPVVFDRLAWFNRVLSFDRQDAFHYPSINFRPLFYRQANESAQVLPKYDLVFIGLLHSSRLPCVRKVQKMIDEQGLSMYVYLTTNLVTWLKLWFKGQAKNVYIKQLSYEEVVDINNQSRGVLDLPHPDQTGLTMRSIESLGFDKKLITTGKDIVNYDFFNDENIKIIDMDLPNIDFSFLSTPYVPVMENIKSRYSLDKWLDDVFFNGADC
ncbi:MULTISPECIES: hypothetical protein [unclassified Brenneria]|uniref:hypothetical protein n=1 Tax=unclassified Brenneria TaxID=2634434 RepID=UPI0018F0E4C3|nr:hypothetical protein [Brenneria sp. L3-3C-1]MBJ7221596.1 hypothetical protein [Brenneria sp. L3-3C-1]MEE3642838.1 hypothetical protein [Brenneria sp. L3_3C_1]